MIFRKFIIYLSLSVLSIQVCAQNPKPAIPVEGPENWSAVSGGKLNRNGRYVMFNVESEPDGLSFKRKDLIIKAVNGRWERKYNDTNIYNCKFSEDGTHALIAFANQKKIYLDLERNLESATWAGALTEASIDDQTKPAKYEFTKKKESLPERKPELAEVDVWGYRDPDFANPWRERIATLEYDYVINKSTGKIFRLTNKNEMLQEVNGGLAIIAYTEAAESPQEKLWNPKARATYYLVSLVDNSRKLIIEEPKEGISSIKFSPDGKFILIANNENMRFSVYNTVNHNLYDISKGREICVWGASYMNTRFFDTDFVFLSNDFVVVRDEYDLWKLDLTGNTEPLNLTNGFGSANRIVFRTVEVHLGNAVRKFHKESNGYLISAFDEKDKSWGFYRLSNLNGRNPVKLYMGPYYYGGVNPTIIRAKSASVFLVKRESVNSSPNFYVTSDFKNFKPLSNVRPEKDYNWVIAELIHWKGYNGRDCDGILYKPENFDSTKKYPVVTIIYNAFTQGFNKFPAFTEGTLGLGYANFLPVTWMVSNGYLVFIPDLEKRELGKLLKSTYDMLLPGVEAVAKLPYVNAKKIGLQGASWGGIQTNYIITQTNLFAAAFSGAGNSEYITQGLYSDTNMRNYYFNGDGGKDAFGGTITEVPESYISQSALFHAAKVTTPLLLRHGIKDGAVAFYQSLQYFRLMRYLRKKVWLLQYDSDLHGVLPGKNLNDMNLRISQFFDHYLKDKPAPKWMTKGIPPDLKQVDSGLGLDPGVEP